VGGPLCGTAKYDTAQYGTSLSTLRWGISFGLGVWLIKGEFRVPYYTGKRYVNSRFVSLSFFFMYDTFRIPFLFYFFIPFYGIFSFASCEVCN